MRLLLLLWAMLASLGLALTGAAAASSPVAASVSLGEEAVAAVPLHAERPRNVASPAPSAHVSPKPAAAVPLYGDRLRE